MLGALDRAAPLSLTRGLAGDRRTRTALRELYGYYRTAEPMLANVTRDAPLLPALRAARAGAVAYLAAVEGILVAGWGGDEARRRAALALALDFSTWQKLRARLPDDTAAADVMTRMVACAGSG